MNADTPVFLPEEVELSGRQVEGGRISFVYRERFTQATYGQTSKADLLANTMKVVGLLIRRLGMDITLFSSEDTIELTGVVDRQTFGNMMVTEFLGWSALGEARLRDLLGSVLGEARLRDLLYGSVLKRLQTPTPTAPDQPLTDEELTDLLKGAGIKAP